jgi:hypothetical protein
MRYSKKEFNLDNLTNLQVSAINYGRELYSTFPGIDNVFSGRYTSYRVKEALKVVPKLLIVTNNGEDTRVNNGLLEDFLRTVGQSISNWVSMLTPNGYNVLIEMLPYLTATVTLMSKNGETEVTTNCLNFDSTMEKLGYKEGESIMNNNLNTMKLSALKQRAIDLSIPKETVRSYGNLSRKDTWIAAIQATKVSQSSEAISESVQIETEPNRVESTEETQQVVVETPHQLFVKSLAANGDSETIRQATIRSYQSALGNSDLRMRDLTESQRKYINEYWKWVANHKSYTEIKRYYEVGDTFEIRRYNKRTVPKGVLKEICQLYSRQLG